MHWLAESLPEYETVLAMFGVGEVLAPQLIDEISDVRRFESKKSLAAFAGINAPPYQSGNLDVKSCRISKCGSVSLRETLFQIMLVILQQTPADEPVFDFLDRKRSEGKPIKST